MAAQRYELLALPGELLARLGRVGTTQATLLSFEVFDRLLGRVEPRDQGVEPLDRRARREGQEESASIALLHVLRDGRQLVG